MTELLDGIDGDIANAWPDRWAKANAARPGASKRRNNLRKAWKSHVEWQDFMSAHPNARCGNCTNFQTQTSPSSRTICLADSDFYGDAIAKSDTLACVRWLPIGDLV